MRARLIAVLLFPFIAFRADAEPGAIDAARQDYMLHCQGCHQPDGAGAEGRVPNLKDSVGNFLRVPGGREYLIRVPGVANSTLGDEQLAGLMNWLLLNFSREQLPQDFVPYSAAEVRRLRSQGLVDVAPLRRDLLEEIADLARNRAGSAAP
ncbi:MAG: cytochrome c [Gammaproteobacteria bacterium]|nr:cytochrome c [Gammaproteobacteria bacterium]